MSRFPGLPVRSSVTAILWTMPCLFGLALCPPATAETEPDEARWHQETRDVWTRGELRPGIRVFADRLASLRALRFPDRTTMWILSEEREVLAVPADSLHASSPGRLDGDPPLSDAEALGHWTDVGDGEVLVEAGSEAILVRRHRGLSGEVDVSALWTAVPRWRELAEEWGEDPGDGNLAAIERLAAVDVPTELEVVFGTWCGDSRRSVPRVVAAVERAGNENLTLRLVGLERGFESPLGIAVERRVTNVPTVIVKRNGAEIGRFVESPRGDSVVTDLAAILGGAPVPPPAKFRESDEEVASGRLEGGSGESETWTLFRTDTGDLRLHVVVLGPTGRVSEIWQRWDAESGRTAFLEVTRDAPGERTRTRLFRRGDGIRTLTRGDRSGIVEQIHETSGAPLVVGPGQASAGLAWIAAGRPDHLSTEVFRVPGAGDGFAARLETLELRHLGSARLEGIGSPVEHVLATFDGETLEMWLDAETGVLLRARPSGGAATVSTAFERPDC